jgi:SAM-dependent methyltransferase
MTYSTEYFVARESWRDWRIEAQTLINWARIAPGTRILEIGCGGGGLLRLLREHGASVVGVDTLDVALALANEQLILADKGTRRKGDKEKNLSLSLIHIGEDATFPFRPNSFDAILAQHVVEHLPEIHNALREWKRLLKPNGRIALATPNALYPDPAHFADADHAHIFAPAELRRACAQAGFIVESCATIFPFLSRARFLRAFGVMGYRLFQRAPYFASRGRTILLSARNGESDE